MKDARAQIIQALRDFRDGKIHNEKLEDLLVAMEIGNDTDLDKIIMPIINGLDNPYGKFYANKGAAEDVNRIILFLLCAESYYKLFHTPWACGALYDLLLRTASFGFLRYRKYELYTKMYTMRNAHWPFKCKQDYLKAQKRFFP